MAPLTLISSCLLFTFALVLVSTAQASTVVGGRTQIKDVGTNKEVQSLGRYAVEEYDRRLRLQGHAGAPKMVSFARVVEAERQVVEGLKYFLKVAVKDNNGEEKMFDAVVVTKPWVKARELLSFTPNH